MSSAAVLAVSGAAALAMVSAFFGVCLARLVWADDLNHARSIDAIRSKTEVSLRSIIASQEACLKLLEH